MISAADILHGKILIVDDQQANVLLLERMLRGAGYASVTSTTDPGEVCELHRKNRYDLILLDLQMPGMDGFQVMEGLKEIETGRLPAGAGHHRPAGSQAARAAGRRQGFHQQAVRSGRGVDARSQHAGGPPAARGGPQSRQDAGIPGAEGSADGSREPTTARRTNVDGPGPCAKEREHHGGGVSGSGRIQADQQHAGSRRRGRAAEDGRRRAWWRRCAKRIRWRAWAGTNSSSRCGTSAAPTMRPRWRAKVIEAVSQPYDIEGQTVSITTSAGIGIYPVARRGRRHADEERGPGAVRGQARGQERLSNLGAHRRSTPSGRRDPPTHPDLLTPDRLLISS